MLAERDTSFKENRSSITSFNTSSRRLIQGIKKPVPQVNKSLLDDLPTATILEINGILQFILIAFVT